MSDAGRVLVLIGLVIVVLGAVMWGLGKSGFKGLPGDIAYQGQNVRVYFPIVSCIVLSIALTLCAWLWRWISGK